MAKSGWCIGPPGARIHHEHCRSLVCSCPCHLDADRLILSGIPVESETSEGRSPGKETDPLATVSTTAKGA